MTRRRRNTAAAAAGPRSRGGWRGGAWLWLVIAVAAAGTGIAAWLRSAAPPAPIPASPADGMSAAEAYDTGLARGQAGRHMESVLFFGAAARLAPDSWTAHQNYANALNNGAQEARIHLGKDEPVTRSSVERIVMMREAMEQFGVAARLAPSDGDRALVAFQRAQTLYTFGLVSDAHVEFQSALAFSPTSRAIVEALEQSAARLRNGGSLE